MSSTDEYHAASAQTLRDTSMKSSRDDIPEKKEENASDRSHSEYCEETKGDDQVPEATVARAGNNADESASLGWARLVVIGLGLWFAVFLYSLDQTIVSNAIPSITDEFHSEKDAGWYGSSYLLTTAAFQLLYGRIYSDFSIKWTLLGSIFIFELGSLICGVAPSSIALIVGRAIAGIGSAGIAAGSFTVIGYIYSLRIRPIAISSLAIIYGVAAVLGPVLGGVFTTNLTWRWCFYINLPFGGLAMGGLFIFLPPLQGPQAVSASFIERLKRLDIIGALIFIPAIICLLLALEWGGTTYAWSNGRIIALFVLFGVLGLGFIGFEKWKGDTATMPMRIITTRSVAAAAWNAFCNGAAFFLLIYYIPQWLQVIQGKSAESAGISLLPFVLGLVVTATTVGFLVMKIGYYAPFMILSTIITPIGEGLMTTWTVHTSSPNSIGYQILAGIGMGMGQQQPQVAIQAVLAKPDIPTGVAIVVLIQTLSGAIFVAIGQAVLESQLASNLKARFPNNHALDASKLTAQGATNVRAMVPAKDLQGVLIAYNNAFTGIFMVALIMSACTVIGSLCIEWKSVKKAKEEQS